MSGIFDFGETAFLSGAKAVVTIVKPKTLFTKPDREPMEFELKKPGATTGKKYRGYVSWGSSNDLPQTLIEKIFANPIVSAALEFKSLLTFGDGVMAVRKEVVNGELKITPVLDNKEINKFFEDNDINGYLLEQATDLQFLYHVFPEIILNNEKSPRIVQLNHKEAAFSRWEAMNPTTGEIENHFYSALWGIEQQPTDMVATPVLSSSNPIMDLKYKLGVEKDPLGKVKESAEKRYIVPISFPSPGRFYYRKPYWVSIIESGWYEFAQAIPEFKMALLNNGMVLKYHIEIHPFFWDKLYKERKATTDAQKKTARTEWYTNLSDFLTGAENAGKIFTSDYLLNDKQEPIPYVKITPLKNEFTGGEYLSDLSEVYNILSYGMGVHPSMIGSQPGANKTINGTEARELFIIKQAMLKPFRDRLLFPLYVVKAINKWPDDIHFTIPNIELTTLDQGTGAKKTISQPSLE